MIGRHLGGCLGTGVGRLGCKDACCRLSDTSWRLYYGSESAMDRADAGSSVCASTTVFLGDKGG